MLLTLAADGGARLWMSTVAEPAPYVFVLSRQLRTDNRTRASTLLRNSPRAPSRGRRRRTAPSRRSTGLHGVRRAGARPRRRASMRTPQSRGASGRMSTSPVGLETPTLAAAARPLRLRAAVLADGTLVSVRARPLVVAATHARDYHLVAAATAAARRPPRPRPRRRRLRPLFRRCAAAALEAPPPPTSCRRPSPSSTSSTTPTPQTPTAAARCGCAPSTSTAAPRASACASPPRRPRGRRRRPFCVAAPVAAACRHARQQRPHRRGDVRCRGSPPPPPPTRRGGRDGRGDATLPGSAVDARDRRRLAAGSDLHPAAVAPAASTAIEAHGRTAGGAGDSARCRCCRRRRPTGGGTTLASSMVATAARRTALPSARVVASPCGARGLTPAALRSGWARRRRSWRRVPPPSAA